MLLHTSRIRVIAPAIVVAAMGILQPGIDPVFLTLLSEAHGLSTAFHGWIVSATQAGLALGSLICLAAGSRLPTSTFAMAAIVALAMSLATAWSGSFPVLLLLRAIYGMGMGILYTQAMAHAARHRPTAAFAAALLLQLVLSMIVALSLPALAQMADAHLALALLAAAPLVALLVLLLVPDALGMRNAKADIPTIPLRSRETPPDRSPLVASRTGLIAAAIFGYVCANMIVWSLTGAMALEAGFSNATIGTAVSLGSLAGAATALAVFGERILVPPKLTAILCGLSLMAPMLAAETRNASLFVFAIVVFNVGATAIVIRGSGFAAATARSTRSLRFISCMHTLGMIVGPAIGSLATMAAGSRGPLIPAASVTLFATLAFIAWYQRPRSTAPDIQTAPRFHEQRQAA